MLVCLPVVCNFVSDLFVVRAWNYWYVPVGTVTTIARVFRNDIEVPTTKELTWRQVRMQLASTTTSRNTQSSSTKPATLVS